MNQIEKKLKEKGHSNPKKGLENVQFFWNDPTYDEDKTWGDYEKNQVIASSESSIRDIKSQRDEYSEMGIDPDWLIKVHESIIREVRSGAGYGVIADIMLEASHEMRNTTGEYRGGVADDLLALLV